MTKKINEYKKLYFNATEFKENMYDFLKLYCDVNDFQVVQDIEDADIILSYNDIKDKEVFNISNNLEKIIDLLN